ncbi:MAG TPA: hypothetical protein VK524_00850 [Polyangiaceae bacterium]|nr:hypothetical protein [Polyangiaceae bacterium]
MVVPSRSGSDGLLVLASGFLAFGLMLGLLTGFSVSAGISQLLVASLFSFVGGVLLSYAGFRRLGSELPDPVRVGAALGCFAVGLIVGTPTGVYMRCNRAVTGWFLGERVEHSLCLSTDAARAAQLAPADAASAARPAPSALSTSSASTGIGAMSSGRTKCIAAQKALSLGVSKVRDEGELHRLIHELIELCGLPQPQQ